MRGKLRDERPARPPFRTRPFRSIHSDDHVTPVSKCLGHPFAHSENTAAKATAAMKEQNCGALIGLHRRFHCEIAAKRHLAGIVFATACHSGRRKQDKGEGDQNAHQAPPRKKGDAAAALLPRVSIPRLASKTREPSGSRRRSTVIQWVRNTFQHLFRAHLPELACSDVPIAQDIFSLRAAGFLQVLFQQALQFSRPMG